MRSERMPALFVGHGSPLNALATNAYTAAWADIGRRLPRPRAVLAVSAHWYVPELAMTTGGAPRTIHDFGGFPPELYAVEYPARGDPALIERVRGLLHPLDVAVDESWGLDHGTWSVLAHVLPAADVPVVQLSIDARRGPPWHYDLGRKLAPLRDEAVLVVGSGDVVHNLRFYAWDGRAVEPYDWCVRFEARVRALIESGNHAPLVDYGSFGRDAVLAVPTPEHYLPLLYVLGAAAPDERVTFPVEGIDGGSVSMLAVQVG